MKVLWLLNFLPPKISQALDFPVQASGSWVMALLDALNRDIEHRAPDILVCGVSDRVAATLHDEIDGVSYAALPQKNGKNALEALLKKEKPDLVQLFGTEGEHAQWCFDLFDPARILVYIQGFAAPCGDHMADGLPEYFLRHQPLKEALAEHTGGLTVRQQKEKLLLTGEKEKRLLAKAQHVLGRTKWDRAYCLAQNPDVNYYHLGEIMRPAFYPGGWRREHCLSHRIFVSQGNTSLKGFHRAIEALPQLCQRWPDTQLYVAGWPPPEKGPLLQPLMNWLSEYSGYLANLAKKLGVSSHIHYTGVLDETGMRHQLMAAETFLLCSSVENSPNSLGEAMLMGLPCVVSDVGGVPSMIETGQGILFAPEEEGSLAAAITALWEDTSNADRLGRAARMRALEDHDSLKIVDQQLEIYKKFEEQKTLD